MPQNKEFQGEEFVLTEKDLQVIFDNKDVTKAIRTVTDQVVLMLRDQPKALSRFIKMSAGSVNTLFSESLKKEKLTEEEKKSLAQLDKDFAKFKISNFQTLVDSEEETNTEVTEFGVESDFIWDEKEFGLFFQDSQTQAIMKSVIEQVREATTKNPESIARVIEIMAQKVMPIFLESLESKNLSQQELENINKQIIDITQSLNFGLPAIEA